MEHAEKTILKTSLITLGVLVVALAIFVAMMSIFAPKTMYNFCSTYGFKNLAFSYAESQYNKSKDINDLHTLLYSAYEVENNRAIIKYSEKLFASPNYDSFIDYINDLNSKSTSIPIAQIAITNENNFIKNKYVQALCNYDCFDKAVDFSLSELENQSTWSASQRTTWLLGTLLNYQNNQQASDYSFLQETAQNSDTFILLSETYLDKMLTVYSNLKQDTSIMENGAYIKNILAYDLNQYLSHIIFLENKVATSLHDFDYYKTAKQNL